jgi:hypothetical protein
MVRLASGITGFCAVIAAAVLLPGGFLLLAWALYRGRFRQPSVRIHNQLRHVGHLKYPPPVTVALEQ